MLMLKLPAKKFSRKVTRGLVLGILSAALLVVIYCWRLGDITPGLSPAEVAARVSSSTLHNLQHHPLNLWHSLPQYGLQKLHRPGDFYMRLVSVVFGLAFIGCFYKISSSWFGKSIGWFSTFMFAFTPIVLLAGRSLTPTVMLLYPLAIGGAYLWLVRHPGLSKLRLVIFLAVVAGGLYIPGMIWLLILGGVLNRKNLKALAQAAGIKTLLGCLAMIIVILVPLGWRLVDNPAIARDLALIPASWPGSGVIAKSIAWAAAGLFWKTGSHADLIIGRLALLDVAQIILIIFGVYAMWHKARTKMYGLIALAVFGVLAAGLNQNIYLLLLSIPPLAILVAAGLRYLYIEWRGVFPNNPIPRSLALALMVAVVSIQMVYGIRYALVAWPHSVATHSLYVLK